MKIVDGVGEMREWSAAACRDGVRIGLVPTMGFLHDGHLSLIERAARKADLLVVSIFVNPTQFGPGEDFERYPRDFERDVGLCEEAGVDVVFCPRAEDMYAGDSSVVVDEGVLSGGLCGRFRPGHFRGVLTVVAKLFNIVRPDVAVFGQKDIQQARLIERMVRDLSFPLRVELGPIVREADGLAMSSRNEYLSESERSRAACLSSSLRLARKLYSDGVREAVRIVEEMERLIVGAGVVDIDYIAAVDYETLESVDEIVGTVVFAVAATVGSTRLIDNTVVPDIPGGGDSLA